jgi:hypothetical protein
MWPRPPKSHTAADSHAQVEQLETVGPEAAAQVTMEHGIA